jgi:exonuclease III
MILLSCNIRGVGGPLKQASFRRLLDQTHPTIIFLQETMVAASVARDFMQLFRPSWLTCAASSVGTSGGLLVSWDPLFSIFPRCSVQEESCFPGLALN